MDGDSGDAGNEYRNVNQQACENRSYECASMLS